MKGTESLKKTMLWVAIGSFGFYLFLQFNQSTTRV